MGVDEPWPWMQWIPVVLSLLLLYHDTAAQLSGGSNTRTTCQPIDQRYLFLGFRVSADWDGAMQECEENESELVTVHNENELNNVINARRLCGLTNTISWIGGMNDHCQGWIWWDATEPFYVDSFYQNQSDCSPNRTLHLSLIANDDSYKSQTEMTKLQYAICQDMSTPKPSVFPSIQPSHHPTDHPSSTVNPPTTLTPTESPIQNHSASAGGKNSDGSGQSSSSQESSSHDGSSGKDSTMLGMQPTMILGMCILGGLLLLGCGVCCGMSITRARIGKEAWRLIDLNGDDRSGLKSTSSSSLTNRNGKNNLTSLSQRGRKRITLSQSDHLHSLLNASHISSSSMSKKEIQRDHQRRESIINNNEENELLGMRMRRQSSVLSNSEDLYRPPSMSGDEDAPRLVFPLDERQCALADGPPPQAYYDDYRYSVEEKEGYVGEDHTGKSGFIRGGGTDSSFFSKVSDLHSYLTTVSSKDGDVEDRRRDCIESGKDRQMVSVGSSIAKCNS